jgi:hypothetical protein
MLLGAQRTNAAESSDLGQWWDTLHITGFLQNSTGMFIDPEAIRQNHSKNSLATERNLLQIDINDNPTENDQIFARWWLVYEPEYPGEAAASSRGGKGAKNLDDFYNDYNFRDAWWQHRFGPLTLYTGRQIAIWGQSVAFRVGDVINPTDTSYAFGFANLEQSRMPVFMVHPILNLPNFKWFRSNYLEGILIPGTDPLYNHIDYPDDRYEGQNVIAGRVNILSSPFSRFAARTETRGSPFAGRGLNPQIPTTWYIPPVTVDNFQEGLRFHTLLGNTETTAFYWHSHQYAQLLYVTGDRPGDRGLQFRFPDYQGFGSTFDRPIYPGQYVNWLNEALGGAPFVVRGEMFYTNHAAIDTLDVRTADGVVYSDTVNYMLALDLAQAAAPWLTETGTLNANFEYQSTVTLSNTRYMKALPAYITHINKQETNLLLNVGTSWEYGVFNPTWTMIYNPDGNTFLLFPKIVFVPPWSSKYFMSLQYIGILGSDRYSVGGGLFKGKSMLLAQFQYNFDLL